MWHVAQKLVYVDSSKIATLILAYGGAVRRNAVVTVCDTAGSARLPRVSMGAAHRLRDDEPICKRCTQIIWRDKTPVPAVRSTRYYGWESLWYIPLKDFDLRKLEAGARVLTPSAVDYNSR